MTSLLSSKPGTACEARRMERIQTGMKTARRTPAAPGPLVSFARFVVCGGGVGVASSAAVAVLASLIPWAVANALITVASTLLCTELHARFTFGAGRRAEWGQHLQSAGSASAAYAVTCAAMLVLHVVKPSAGMLTEQAVYLSAAGLAGIGRFLVLRLFVFAGGRTRTRTRTGTAVSAKSPAWIREASTTVSSPVPVPARRGGSRAVGKKVQVLERGSDMVLAAHYTSVGSRGIGPGRPHLRGARRVHPVRPEIPRAQVKFPLTRATPTCAAHADSSPVVRGIAARGPRRQRLACGSSPNRAGAPGPCGTAPGPTARCAGC
jgi:putative flippase GtrA